MWYKGQPLVCDICNDNHKAADCPLKAKCRRCHQAGNFVRKFPKPVWYVPGNPATDVDSENDDDGDKDDENVGNDEGVNNVAVPVVSGAVEPAVGSVVSVPSSPVAPAPGVDVVSGGWALRPLRSALVPLWVPSVCV